LREANDVLASSSDSDDVDGGNGGGSANTKYRKLHRAVTAAASDYYTRGLSGFDSDDFNLASADEVNDKDDSPDEGDDVEVVVVVNKSNNNKLKKNKNKKK
jgi:hypothetical protein